MRGKVERGEGEGREESISRKGGRGKRVGRLGSPVEGEKGKEG